MSGHSGRVLILSTQPMPSCPAPTHRWWMWASGVLLHWQLRLSAYSLFLFFLSPGYDAVWDYKTPQRPASERDSCCLETSPPSWLPPQDGSPSLTLLSLFLSILSYLLSKRTGCLSGCLVFSASIQRLFCGSCSAIKWSFDEFVGEKMVSLSYSSTILGPPPEFHIVLTYPLFLPIIIPYLLCLIPSPLF